MYDDLYCQNIYNFFNNNSLIGLAASQNQGKHPYYGTDKDFEAQIENTLAETKEGNSDLLHQNFTASLIDRTIQYYLKNGDRKTEIKIFKAVIT